MTLTEQQQEDFARICPSWAEIFQTYKFNVMMESSFCKKNLCKISDEDLRDDLNIQDGSCCVLGEAYGFKDSCYGDCKMCDDISYVFANCGYHHAINGKKYYVRNQREFETVIKLFLRHFKSQHPELYNKKLK